MSSSSKFCSLRFFLTLISRSSQRSCSVRKGVLKNFAKFTGKHKSFSVNFAKFLRTPFLQSRLFYRTTVSEYPKSQSSSCCLYNSEAAVQRCSQQKVFCKYAAKLQKSTHAEALCNFIEITIRLGCSPVNLLHIFSTPFSKNTSEWLLLIVVLCLTLSLTLSDAILQPKKLENCRTKSIRVNTYQLW